MSNAVAAAAAAKKQEKELLRYRKEMAKKISRDTASQPSPEVEPGSHSKGGKGNRGKNPLQVSQFLCSNRPEIVHARCTGPRVP
jgi:hypothetical protein